MVRVRSEVNYWRVIPLTKLGCKEQNFKPSFWKSHDYNKLGKNHKMLSHLKDIINFSDRYLIIEILKKELKLHVCYVIFVCSVLILIYQKKTYLKY